MPGTAAEPATRGRSACSACSPSPDLWPPLAGVVPGDQRAQRGHLPSECRTTFAGDADPGLRPPAVVALLHPDQVGLLEHGDVPGEVAGGEIECVAQVAELDP